MLSGMRPHELPAIRRIYSPYVNLTTEETTYMSHDDYGDWCCWSCKTKLLSSDEYKDMFSKLTEMAME